MGRWIIIAGCIMIVTGIILQYAPWLVSWFGKLPGDIRYESGRNQVYIPVTSMILVSLGLTLLINVIRRIL